MPRHCCHNQRGRMPCAAGRPRVCVDSISASRFPRPCRPIPSPVSHAPLPFPPRFPNPAPCFSPEPAPSNSIWEADCDSLCDLYDVGLDVVDDECSAYCPYDSDEECFESRNCPVKEEYITTPTCKATRTFGTDPYCMRPPQYLHRPPAPQYFIPPPPPRYCREPEYNRPHKIKPFPDRYNGEHQNCRNNTCGHQSFASRPMPLKKPICCPTSRPVWGPVGSVPMNTFTHGPLNLNSQPNERCSSKESAACKFSNQMCPGEEALRRISQGVGNSRAYTIGPSDASPECYARQPARCNHCGGANNMRFQEQLYEDTNRHHPMKYKTCGVDAISLQNPYAENYCNTHAMGPASMAPKFMDYMREWSIPPPCKAYRESGCSASDGPITIENESTSVQHPDIGIEVRSGYSTVARVEAIGTEVDMKYIDTCRCAGTYGGMCWCSGASSTVCKCSKPVNFKCSCPEGSMNCECLSRDQPQQGNKRGRQTDCFCSKNQKRMEGCACWSNGQHGVIQCGCTDQNGNRVAICQCNETNKPYHRLGKDKVICKCELFERVRGNQIELAKENKKKKVKSPSSHSSQNSDDSIGENTRNFTNDVVELQKEMLGAGDVYEEVKKNVASLARDIETKKILSDDMTEKVRNFANSLADIQKAITNVNNRVHNIKKTEQTLIRVIGERKSISEDEETMNLILEMPRDISEIQTETSNVKTVANDIKNDITTLVREIENSKKMDDGLRESTAVLTRNLSDLQAKATNVSMVTDSISKDYNKIIQIDAIRQEEMIVNKKHKGKKRKEKSHKRKHSKQISYDVNNVQINGIQIDARNGSNQITADTFTGIIESNIETSNVFLTYSSSQIYKEDAAKLQNKALKVIHSNYNCESNDPVRDLVLSQEEPINLNINYTKKPRANETSCEVYIAKQKTTRVEQEYGIGTRSKSIERPHNFNLLSPKICKARKKRDSIMLKRVVNMYDHFDSILKDSKIVLTSGASGTLKKTPSSYDRMKHTNKSKSMFDTYEDKFKTNYEVLGNNREFEILYVNELTVFLAETAPRETTEIFEEPEKNTVEQLETEDKLRTACGGTDGGQCYCTDIKLPECGKKTAKPTNSKRRTVSKDESKESGVPNIAEVQTDLQLTACECRYPPAYTQLSCTGKLVGNCCCGKYLK